jgi:hypothetical protein
LDFLSFIGFPILFRTDYLPLNKMAAQAQADRIRNAALNPAADAGADTAADRLARLKAQTGAEENRRSGLLTMPTMPSASPQPSKPDKQVADKGKTATSDLAKKSDAPSKDSGAAAKSATAPGTQPKTTSGKKNLAANSSTQAKQDAIAGK